jgi:hypothetical protein
MKARRHIYLDEELTERLRQLTAKPGSSRSAIVTAALRAYLDRQGADELDARLNVRLDKLTRQLRQIERDVGIVMETLALYVRYALTVTAPPADGDRSAANAIGHERFQSFVEQVGRRLARGKSLRADVLGPEGNGHDH